MGNSPRGIKSLGAAILEEEPDIWITISSENVHINYSEVMAMDKNERLLAYAAVTEINRIREAQRNKK